MNTIVLKEKPEILMSRDTKSLMKIDFDDIPKEFIFEEFSLAFPIRENIIITQCMLDGEEPSRVKYTIPGLKCFFVLLPAYLSEPYSQELKKIEVEYGFDYRWGCLQIWGNHLGNEDYEDFIVEPIRKAMYEYGDELYETIITVGLVVLSEITKIMEQSIKRKKLIKKGVPLKHKYSREHRLSIPNKKIWLFDDIVQYTCDQFIEHKGKYTIQCPCWEVRGHYRHYKSGKVVFIKSFKKGKYKETAEPINHEYYTGRTAE